MKADLQSVINEIKERILHVYGYDKDLNFIGKRRGIKPIEPKTHLSPKEFLKFANRGVRPQHETISYCPKGQRYIIHFTQKPPAVTLEY